MLNIYHIIYKIPALQKEEMLIEYEDLAQALVKSGKLRVDAEPKSNFVRLSEPRLNTNIAFSYEELNDSQLLKRTKEKLKNIYQKIIPKQLLEQKTNSVVKTLNNMFIKHIRIDKEELLKLSRLLVQSTHPIVIRWILIEEVEVFISYSNQIGDVMDVATWKYAGSNSGMQSTKGDDITIYVSCGGNPFGTTNSSSPMYGGDGWPAIARLQIIAAQELGHYADICRNMHGSRIGRHSVNNSYTKARNNVLLGRRNDLARCYNNLTILQNYGLDQLIKNETQLKFYRKNKIKGLRLQYIKLLSFLSRQKFYFRMKKEELLFTKVYRRERYPGLMLKAMIQDMIFNLEPKADVYKRDDPDEDEAVACIEALARVPQQVIKWGHLTTMAMMYELYEIYYKQVIPSLISSYQSVSGIKYRRSYKYINPGIKYKLKKLLSFFKKKDVPSREI